MEDSEITSSQDGSWIARVVWFCQLFAIAVSGFFLSIHTCLDRGSAHTPEEASNRWAWDRAFFKQVLEGDEELVLAGIYFVAALIFSAGLLFCLSRSLARRIRLTVQILTFISVGLILNGSVRHFHVQDAYESIVIVSLIALLVAVGVGSTWVFKSSSRVSGTVSSLGPFVIAALLGSLVIWIYIGEEALTERPLPEGVRMAMIDIHFSQRRFVEEDSDGNGREDFWVGDVDGLNAMPDPDGDRGIRLLDYWIGAADKGRLNWDHGLAASRPLRGYWFYVVPIHPAGRPYTDGKDAEGLESMKSSIGYAVQAIPIEEMADRYPMAILDDSGELWTRNDSIARITKFPEFPKDQGWELIQNLGAIRPGE